LGVVGGHRRRVPAEIANESEYGLMCAIYSGDMERALRVARRIDVGMVFVNNYFRGILGTPFGGVKHSGFGRGTLHRDAEGISSAKMIRYPSGLATVPSWRAVTEIFGVPGSRPGVSPT